MIKQIRGVIIINSSKFLSSWEIEIIFLNFTYLLYHTGNEHDAVVSSTYSNGQPIWEIMEKKGSQTKVNTHITQFMKVSENTQWETRGMIWVR